MNFFAGGGGIFVCVSLPTRSQLTDLLPFEVTAYILLFAFTYFLVALNQYLGNDVRGLGWFSFFVAVTAVPVTIRLFLNSNGQVWPTWLAICWASWAILWALFFGQLVLKMPIAKLNGWGSVSPRLSIPAGSQDTFY